MARILNHRTRSEEIITSLVILILNDKRAWKSCNVKADSEILIVFSVKARASAFLTENVPTYLSLPPLRGGIGQKGQQLLAGVEKSITLLKISQS